MISKNVNYIKDDFKSAFSLHYSSSFPIRSRLMLVLGIILLLIGVVLFFANIAVFPYLKFIFLAMGVFYLAFYFYRKSGIVDNAMRNAGLSGEHTITISDNGVNFEGEKGLSEQNWNAITHCNEDASSWLIYFSPSQFYIVPKRLYSAEEKSRVDALLAEKIIPADDE